MRPEQPLASATPVGGSAALEAAADRLLRAHTRRGDRREYPFYSPSSLRQMSRREEQLSRRQGQGDGAGALRAALLLDALTDRLDLDASNGTLLELIRAGWTVNQVATRLQLTPKAVRRRLERIVRRLRYTSEAAGGFDALLRECYRDQTSLHRYREERHCRPGHEACRKDGLCKYRWYLFGVTAEADGEC